MDILRGQKALPISPEIIVGRGGLPCLCCKDPSPTLPWPSLSSATASAHSPRPPRGCERRKELRRPLIPLNGRKCQRALFLGPCSLVASASKKGKCPSPRQGLGPQSPAARTGVIHEKKAFPTSWLLLPCSPCHPTPLHTCSVLFSLRTCSEIPHFLGQQ